VESKRYWKCVLLTDIASVWLLSATKMKNYNFKLHNNVPFKPLLDIFCNRKKNIKNIKRELKSKTALKQLWIIMCINKVSLRLTPFASKRDKIDICKVLYVMLYDEKHCVMIVVVVLIVFHSGSRL
jgi:hypothetical protein